MVVKFVGGNEHQSDHCGVEEGSENETGRSRTMWKRRNETKIAWRQRVFRYGIIIIGQREGRKRRILRKSCPCSHFNRSAVENGYPSNELSNCVDQNCQTVERIPYCACKCFLCRTTMAPRPVSKLKSKDFHGEVNSWYQTVLKVGMTYAVIAGILSTMRIPVVGSILKSPFVEETTKNAVWKSVGVQGIHQLCNAALKPIQFFNKLLEFIRTSPEFGGVGNILDERRWALVVNFIKIGEWEKE